MLLSLNATSSHQAMRFVAILLGTKRVGARHGQHRTPCDRQSVTPETVVRATSLERGSLTDLCGMVSVPPNRFDGTADRYAAMLGRAETSSYQRFKASAVLGSGMSKARAAKSTVTNVVISAAEK